MSGGGSNCGCSRPLALSSLIRHTTTKRDGDEARTSDDGTGRYAGVVAGAAAKTGRSQSAGGGFSRVDPRRAGADGWGGASGAVVRDSRRRTLPEAAGLFAGV